MRKWPLPLALLAAVAGIAMLTAWFGKYWPVSTWTVLSRPQLIEKGRTIAASFGLDVKGWNAYLVASLPKSATSLGQGIAPLTARITYVSPDGFRAAEVGFDPDGTLNYWRQPSDFTPAHSFPSYDAAANAVFQLMAGKQASNYKKPTSTAGDEPREWDFEFRKLPAPSTDIRESITVRTKDSFVERAEHKVGYGYNYGNDDDDDGYWAALAGLYGFIYAIGIIVVGAILILWLVRRSLGHQFQLRLAGAAFVIMLLVMLAGSDWDKAHSVNLDHDARGGPELVVALGIFAFAAVGRGISATARPKWMSLEQLCLLAPIAKPTGESLAVGLLFGPLLAAVPFLIAGCGLFPHSWVLPHNAELLWGRAPFLDALPIRAGVGALLFMGFELPALKRLIPFRWLRWPIVLSLGTAFFADLTRLVSGPVQAPLAAGLLTFLLFWFVWSRFDLLAMFTMQVASALVLGLLTLMEKSHGGWTFLAAFCCLAFAAFCCHRYGQPVAEGDPYATNPLVTGFRAEREKLLAEFSLARRAQQDMLPQSPPSIPGYSIAASCTPSLEVGGDLYDFLKLQDGRIGIGVADVSGKGVPAALYMTLTKGLLSAVTRDSSELGPVVQEVNRHLHGVTRRKTFVTMALGFLDPEKRLLQCVRAGHNPVVWRQKQKNLTTLVSPGGLGLGITAGKVFGTQLKVEEMNLSEGDTVVFYSDGITEAMNRGLEQFGEQRLMDAVDRTDSLDATASHDSILSEVRAFLDGVHPQDDMTLVVLRVDQ